MYIKEAIIAPEFLLKNPPKGARHTFINIHLPPLDDIRLQCPGGLQTPKDMAGGLRIRPEDVIRKKRQVTLKVAYLEIEHRKK